MIHPRRSLRQQRRRGQTPEEIFTEIYWENGWKGGESASGLGSSLAQTVAIRTDLPKLIREFGWRSMLDLPCGDFHWMSRVDLDVDYVGADVVKELVRRNRAQYARDRRRFVELDLLSDALPTVDLVLCRDCLVHFSDEHVRRALGSIVASGSEYLLTTTHPSQRGNRDVVTGGFRPLNLQAPPFDFPPPIRLIDENCTHRGTRGRKCLGLWPIAELPLKPACTRRVPLASRQCP